MAEYNYNFQEKIYADKTTPEDIEDNWLWAIIGYFGPFSFLTLMISRKSPFANFHARQGIGLFIIQVIWLITWTVANLVIPFDNKYVFWGTTAFFVLGEFWQFYFLIIGIINSYNGVMKALPMVGKYFETDR